MQSCGMCTFEVVHPLSIEEIATRTFGEGTLALGAYVENSLNTEKVIGLSKEVVESRDRDGFVKGKNRYISPGIISLW